MSSPSSWPQLMFWQQGDRRCELWMRGGIPELRIYIRDRLLYKELAPLEALHDRAEQLRTTRPVMPSERPSERPPNWPH